jgi:LVIVD repeat
VNVDIMRRFILILSTSLFLIGCDPAKDDLIGTVDAYVPVYGSFSEIHQISVEPPKPTLQAGNIYAYGNYIFQNDLYSGIHIIDNRNHHNPVKIAFLKLPLSTEIAVKGNYLYANNYVDLVVFDITDPAKPQLVKRVNNVIQPSDQKFPPFSNVYFQCPDNSKGIVVRWELQNMIIPNCRR